MTKKTDDRSFIGALDVVARADARLHQVIRALTRGGASYAYRSSVMRPFEEAKMELQMLRAGMLNAQGNRVAIRTLLRDPQPPRVLLQVSGLLLDHADSVLGDDALPREMVKTPETLGAEYTMELCQRLQTVSAWMIEARQRLNAE
jgi:hypothetical protein